MTEKTVLITLITGDDSAAQRAQVHGGEDVGGDAADDDVIGSVARHFQS